MSAQSFSTIHTVTMSDIYSYSVSFQRSQPFSCVSPPGYSIDGHEQVEFPKSTLPLSDLKGKTLLFVNVASKCG